MTGEEIAVRIRERAEAGEMLALDVGCGLKRAEPGAIGMDWSAESGADVVWDVDRLPWPLPESAFSRIHLSHIIEHAADILGFMREVHRVARHGAEIVVTTPHFSSHNSYTDPTHRRHLAAASFEYFTGREFATFVGPMGGFELRSVELTFGGNFVLDGLGRWIARRSLKWYERHAAWVLPALDIRARLAVVKA